MDYKRHHNSQDHYSPHSHHTQNHYSSHYEMKGHGPVVYQKSRDLPHKVVVAPRKVRIIPVPHDNYAVIRKEKKTSYRKCLLFGCLALMILAAIVTGVTMYILGRGDSGPGECKVVSYTSSISFTLRQFTSIYADKTSDSYQNFVSQFCSNLTSGLEKQMTMNECAKKPTDHCQVSSLEKGSIVVNFTVKQVIDSTKIKSDGAMERQMQKAIEQVVADGKNSRLSDNDIFKEKTTQGEISVGEKVTAKQCQTLSLPENIKRLSSTSQTNLVGTTISWTCKAGYKFPSNETKTSSTCGENGYWSYYPNKPCEDIDECASNPCLNDATCVNGENGFECTCPPGYDGVNCENRFDDCLANACMNGATCVDLEDAFRCDCPTGFSGDHCEDNFDDCATNLCKNDVPCVDGANSYVCECPMGLIGTYCETNIDDCASNPCDNDATCVDEVNGYICECAAGFSGPNCDTDIDECASSPCVNGTCMDGVGQYVCECSAGYSGVHCDDEIDECLSTPCQNDGTCTDAVNEYECDCPPGFAGPECNLDCATSLQDEIICLPFDLTEQNGFEPTKGLWLDLFGVPSILPDCGVKDKCGRFDGVDDFIEIPYFKGNNHVWESFSVAFWFKRDSTSSGEQSLITNDCGGSTETFFVNSVPGKISAGAKTANDDALAAYTDIAVTDDEWHHIALVYDGSGATVLLYVDNVPVTPAGVATGNLMDTTCSMTIAKDNFKGLMDEIYIYGNDLSAEEVSILYSKQC